MFDQIWLNHILTKSEAYRWIADKFCLTAKEAHIGEFSIYMCDQLILESMKILENNHILSGPLVERGICMIIPMTDDERRLTEEYLYLVPEW